MRDRRIPGSRTLGPLAGTLGGVLLIAVSSAWAYGPYREGDLPEGSLGAHGDMAGDAQIERLEALLPERDPAEPPPAIDAGFWDFLIPDDNEMTAERVALGKKLYFDTALSGDGTVSCATCHDVSRGFTDQRPTSEGIRGQLGRRNAPTTMNAFFYPDTFLDGRTEGLEEQAKFPPVNAIEGGHESRDAVVAAIRENPDYAPMFQAAYGSEPNYDDMARAIAAFQRTLVFLDSPFDRYLAGDEDAISEKAKLGWQLYNGKGRCVSCHMINPSMPIGTDNRFHNIGVAARAQDFEKLASDALEALAKDGGPDAVDQLALQTDLSELGRFLATKDRADIGAFKTQAVRNVGITAPYMHDGSMRTLWDVMDHYNKGGESNPFLDGGIEPLALTENEIDALVELMFAMTDSRFADENQAELETQRQIAGERRPFRDEALAQREVFLFERRVTGEEKPGKEEGDGAEVQEH